MDVNLHIETCVFLLIFPLDRSQHLGHFTAVRCFLSQDSGELSLIPFLSTSSLLLPIRSTNCSAVVVDDCCGWCSDYLAWVITSHTNTHTHKSSRVQSPLPYLFNCRSKAIRRLTGQRHALATLSSISSAWGPILRWSLYYNPSTIHTHTHSPPKLQLCPVSLYPCQFWLTPSIVAPFEGNKGWGGRGRLGGGHLTFIEGGWRWGKIDRKSVV